MITIVDYGIGNVRSLGRVFDRLRLPFEVTADRRQVARASKLVLPGVGAFDVAMNALRASGLEEPLNEAVVSRRAPTLGVCLGMQLLGESSEEGTAAGLGWLRARARRFDLSIPATPPLRLPHMGWAQVRARRATPLLPEAAIARFYFVHSYHLVCDEPDDVFGVARHGHEFVAAVHRENIWGVQFHPEKSHRFGMALLSAFGTLP